ncbi:MAG: citrate/2-methylcitrate synthase, partial [Candidatus Binatia bacterium]
MREPACYPGDSEDGGELVDRNAQPYIAAKLKAKAKIMGVGHRIYKVKDPRAFALQSLAEHLFTVKGEHPLYKVAQE